MIFSVLFMVDMARQTFENPYSHREKLVYVALWPLALSYAYRPHMINSNLGYIVLDSLQNVGYNVLLL